MDSVTPEIFDLASRPDKTDAVLNLIERNFPKGFALSEPISLEKEFFSLLAPENRQRILFACDENDDPVSALGWKLFTVQEKETQTKISVAAIGLVVTAEAHRGKGYSSAVLAAAEERALKEGALLCCLWSGMEFYLNRDYLPLGSELSWVCDTREYELLERRIRTEAPPATFSLNAAKDADIPAALKLFEETGIGPKRDPGLYRSFRALPDTEFLVAKDSAQNLLGYALIGKAQDLRHTLHEIIGDKAMVPACLERLIAQTRGDDKAMIRVQYPADGMLGEELQYWLGTKQPEAFALIKLLNPRAFVDYLMKNRILGNLLIECLDEGFRILDGAGREEFFSPDHSHLTQLFVSPFHPREFGTLSAKLIAALENFRPLNPYFWGLDSV